MITAKLIQTAADVVTRTDRRHPSQDLPLLDPIRKPDHMTTSVIIFLQFGQCIKGGKRVLKNSICVKKMSKYFEISIYPHLLLIGKHRRRSLTQQVRGRINRDI